MSVQVGAFCYAGSASAAPAACAAFTPVTSISGDTVTTLSCGGVDGAGGLVIQRSVVTGSSSPVVSTFTQSLAYPPCVQSDYAAAVLGVFGSLLLAWAVIWGMRKLLRLFHTLPVS